MEVVSACSLPVGWIVWRSRSGSDSLTVVCKATYALAPIESPLADGQDPLHEVDRFWNDDPRQALRLAGDLAPFKRRADVILTGHAYAPRGEAVRSLVARLVVGEVDKAVEVFVDRVFTAEGELREGPRFTRAPLHYPYAAGGPDTVNPVGVPRDAPPDVYGQRALPRLQPPGLHVTGPGDYIPPVGFGPIAPRWPDRLRKLAHHAATWDPRTWRERPLPDDIDAAYFNAAPPDQQMDAIRPSERLVLENLDPDHPRLVTNLVTATPWATVEWPGRSDEDVGFRCDTLWIDTDRRRCSLTWRAAIPLQRGEQPSRVLVRLGAREEASSRRRDVGSTTIDGVADSAFALPFTPASEDNAPTVARRAYARPLAGAVLGGMRLATPRAAAPSAPPFALGSEVTASSPFDLDADTFASVDDVIADEETQDRWEVTQAPSEILPFAPPTSPLFPAPEPAAASPWSAPVPEPSLLPLLAPLASEPEPSALPPPGPPAPPPLLGPLATPEMLAVNEAALPTGPAPSADTAPPVVTDAPEALPLPLDRFPIAACARIAASIARRKAETASLLAEQGLAPEVWSALEKHWAAALSEEVQRGKITLLRAYDEAYVGRLEEERGAITPREHARLILAVERGRAEVVLAELDLPRGAILRIQRVWLARIAADAAFNKSVRSAMAAESEGEE